MDATLIIKAGVNGPNLDVIERNFDERKFLQRDTFIRGLLLVWI